MDDQILIRHWNGLPVEDLMQSRGDTGRAKNLVAIESGAEGVEVARELIKAEFFSVDVMKMHRRFLRERL